MKFKKKLEMNWLYLSRLGLGAGCLVGGGIRWFQAGPIGDEYASVGHFVALLAMVAGIYFLDSAYLHDLQERVRKLEKKVFE